MKGKMPQKKRVVDELLGKFVVIQEVSGSIVEGELISVDDNIFYLTKAKIKGKNFIAHTPLVGINKNRIEHFHLAPTKLEPIEQ